MEVSTESSEKATKHPTNQLRTYYDNLLHSTTTVAPEYKSPASTKHKKLSEVSITIKWQLTLTEKRFLFAHDTYAGVTIFAFDKNLSLLLKSEAFLSNGTLKSCPDLTSRII